MAWVSCQTKLSYKYRRRTHTVTPALEESYLRVDISCGSEACDSCRVGSATLGVDDDVGGGRSGAGTVVTASLAAAAPYYLIPDAAAVSELLEVFELPDISNYIVLASCIKQVSLRSGRKASRLRALYRDRRRRAVLFDDLHCLDTAAAASGEDPSLPPVLAAGLYYARHLGGRVPIVVVSDTLAAWMEAAAAAGGAAAPPGSGGSDGGLGSLDPVHDCSALADTLAEAVAEGVTVLSVAEYVARFWPPGSPVSELYDSIMAAAKAAAAAGGAGGGGDASYPPHLSQQEVEEGLASGQLLRGVVHVSRRSPTEAVVEVGHGPDTALGRLVRLSGRTALNRAMEGDVVAVRLLPPGGPAPGTSAVFTAPASTAADADADVDDDAEGSVSGSTAASAASGGGGAAGGSGAVSATADSVDYGAELLAAAEGAAAGGEEGALATADASASGALPAATVVAILQRDPRDIVACLSTRDESALRARLDPGSSLQTQQQRRSEILMCIPLDRRLPPVVVVTRQAGQLVGSRFVVRVDSWERSSRYPRGHVTRVLGRMNDLKAESEAVLVQCGIHHKPFCEAALAELPRVASAADWRVSPRERALRRDLTGPEYFVVSIDPVGCTDVDDAMHVRFLGPPADPADPWAANPPQRVEVGVHIADVSWFVAAGGMLDGEARDRCTSVYLADRRLDMLPGLLSEQLCSLRQGVERFAVSVVWTLARRSLGAGGRRGRPEAEGEGGGGGRGGDVREYEYVVEDVWFGRTIIRSRHQLHYQQAQDILDGRPAAPGDELPTDHVATLRRSLRVLDELTGQLHAQRVAAGALELASAELRFKVDPETGAPCAVVCKQKVAMMDVVAEMMIAANSAVAERIATAYPGCALLRNHPPPRAQAFEQVRALLEAHSGGVPVDPTSNASLAAALARASAAAAAADPAAATLIKSLATRAMSEAQYNSSGTTPPGTPLSYHYGLALQYYTHFTSPIRRYADVVVHRQLLAALSSSPPPLLHPDLAAAAHTMNVRHRQAKAAQKECSELYLLLLLHAQPHVERALVCGVSGDRVELFIPSYHLRGAVALADSRGLPRPPLRAGQPDGPEAEADAFALAERRRLRLSTTAESATIIDSASGAVVWSVRLWQPVSVRLSAAGHRAHGPKLAMRLLDPGHPDALPLALAQPVSPLTVAVSGRPAGAPLAPAGAGAPVAGGSAASAAHAALPPHLRLLMDFRNKQRRANPQHQQQTEGQVESGRASDTAEGCRPAASAAAAGLGPPGTATATAQGPEAVSGRGLGPVGSAVGEPVRTVAAGAGDGVPEMQSLLQPQVPPLDVDLEAEQAVLRAPADALVAAAAVQAATALLLDAGGLADGGHTRGWSSESGSEASGRGLQGEGEAEARGEHDVAFGGQRLELPELRAHLRRVSRLEMRLLACRKGSTQERKIRERLDELKGHTLGHVQA